MDASVAEALRAELKPIRQAKFRDHRVRVRQGTDQERDLVCDDCLKFYEGNCDREFSPDCKLTTDIQAREKKEIFDHLTEDEQLQFWYMEDPIAWAKVELDWDPRWYQIEPLRCSAKKKVFRMGRQIGKTEILAILALFDLITKPNSWIVILCPYQDQVDLVFKRLRAFIQKSEVLSNPDFKVRDKMNPHEIEYAHPEGNSWVLGMTAGVRTGQQGNKFRGQTPTLLIIDEADMLDDMTLESVLASLTGAGPIARMVVSSTPTGRRGMYWKYCTNKRLDFREFHYTSMVSPYWTPELELFYRETYSENGFAHEFLAEFGEMEVGVFQHKYIEASLQDYSLAGAVPRAGEMYSMGVDWNRKGIGVHIIISGFDFTTSKFRVSCKRIVDANEFTQHRAIQEIVKLNEIWNPEYIYVDEGDGTTQVEALHLWGMQHPNTRLHRKVKGVDFGSKTLIRDPLTKQFVKKATKPLVVDLCARQVERLNCILPKGEDTQNGLVGQMREFAIIRYGREGQPVYADDKEHTLIAWMLSVYAVVIELTDIARVKGSSKIAFTGPLGQGQSDLIAAHKIREFRERKRKLTPLPRTFDTGYTRSKLNQGSMSDFIGMHADSLMRGFRKRAGHMSDSRSGHMGRPTWDRSRTNRLKIPNDYD
jgi:replicative DNA helicase